MSKTKFPHPSAPSIAKTNKAAATSPTGSSSRLQNLAMGKAPPRAQLSGKAAAKRHGSSTADSTQRRHPAGASSGKSLTAVAALTSASFDSESDGSDDLDISGDGPDFPRGGISGPRPVYCVCRRSTTSSEGMLKCTDCKELFHGSCVGVAPHTIQQSPLYLCESCLQQHPRRKRVPGTILGIGSRIASEAASTASARKTKKKQRAQADSLSDDDGNGVIYLRPNATSQPAGNQMLARAEADAGHVPRVALLPAANQAALAAFSSAAAAGETMDDDDICPICEDECTCGNARSQPPIAPTGSAFAGQNGANFTSSKSEADDGPAMPLFSQIARIVSHGGHQPTEKREASTKKNTKKTESRAPKTAVAKPRSKPRAKKGKGSEKNLIPRMVDDIGGSSSGGEGVVEYELLDDDALLAAPGDGDEGLNLSDGLDGEFVDTAFDPAHSRSAVSRASSEAAPLARLQKASKPAAKPKTTATTKSKPAAKRGRPPKAASGQTSWDKKKQAQAAARVQSKSAFEPLVYQVNSTVIRGRDRRQQAAKRGLSPLRAPSEGMSGDDDEFINITDVTSDASSTGYPSETEFDLPSTQGEETPTAVSARANDIASEWSDTNMRIISDDDADGEDIEKAEEAYLIHMEENEFSSSSLSDLDDERLAGIRRGRVDNSDIDSGDESDSESNDGDGGVRNRMRRRRRRAVRAQTASFHDFGSGSDIGSLSDIGSISSLSSDEDSETDQELTFREPKTEEERALVNYVGSDDEKEEAMLSMHLDQLRAVRNVLPYCSSSPLLESSDAGSDIVSDVDVQIAFTYHQGDNSDANEDLSDDLMDGWATEVRRRWETDSDSSSDSSALSESKIDKLRLKGDEDDNHSDLYSSDSYDEFYARSAFLDMGSDGDDDGTLEDSMYPPGLDLDSASLALGVALSMEQQGYSKEDAAAAAAAAAAAYPGNGGTGGGGSIDVLGKQVATTTITASMNANGEADPIDGIVSIKSSTNANGTSRMATGTHTPYLSSGWRSAYLDSPGQPALSYVLPKDLNEARSPNVALAAAAAAQAELDASAKQAVEADAGDSASAAQFEASAATTATVVTGNGQTNAGLASLVSKDAESHSLPKPTEPQSATVSRFTSQLPNSSFYKPLSSICSPIRRASSATAVPQAAQRKSSEEYIPQLDAAYNPGAPLVSLAEVNAALSVLVDQSTPNSPPEHPGLEEIGTGALKRKLSSGSITAGAGDDKRIRGDEPLVGFEGIGADGGQIPLDLSMLFAAENLSSGLPCPGTPQRVSSASMALGAGTPIRSGPGRLYADDQEAGGSDMDDWLMNMDQLVDTDALMIKSPPPSPAEGAGSIDIGSDISRQLSSIGAIGGGHRPASAAPAGGVDMFARWDRIPVNIFRRSRALASSRRRDMVSQDDMMGAVSSLALTAIKSSRQRRALINTTLLAQHTLPAEAALQQNAIRQAVRDGRRAMRNQGMQPAGMALPVPPPPPPPPTPLSASHIAPVADGVATSNLHRSSSAVVARTSSMAADLQNGLPRSLVSAGSKTEAGTPWETLSQVSDHSEATAASAAAAAARAKLGRNAALEDAADSDGEYAFGWLEDEEDLSLFAMPGLSADGNAVGSQEPLSMTMVLASASPMLMPFKASANGGSGSGGGSEPHLR
ncbi:hypothetical protein LPJ53_000064 [Coemansia erecta]|uniref:Zinc finger PHD-type domain-containing protein n=1 Tax=Coemansia erecta TaxID=147472 RepID=A0A9W8CW30_9FUNG|nr:hypothetical protein LPJ53_000064 [Coemansia erecta]